MPDIELNRLRKLRGRADALLANLVSDLTHFQQSKKINGFRRKPDSNPDEVNVTTTCSCLMGLAHSRKLGEFYESIDDPKVDQIFNILLDAPWMSSGLAENNAFTTTLMIRLFGSLVDAEAFKASDVESMSKEWESGISFLDFAAFSKRLCDESIPFCKYLFRFFPCTLQDDIRACSRTGKTSEKLELKVSDGLGRIMTSTYLFDDKLFSAQEIFSKDKRTSSSRAGRIWNSRLKSAGS